MVEFNKSVFDNTFKAISSIQDNSISMLTAFMDKVPGLPSEREKALQIGLRLSKKVAMTLKQQPIINMKRLRIIS